MEEFMLGRGNKIKCMAMDNSNGQMEGLTMETM